MTQVYISAIEGHVPPEMVQAFNAYLDFCYLVRRSIFTTDTLKMVDEALFRFHHHRRIFQTTGTREDTPKGLSLPRQHAMVHYRQNIEAFGAPNGLCSSITESKHIIAVKKPWRRSSKYNALGQMLLTNQRLDKLTASRVDFERRGMLESARHDYENQPTPSFHERGQEPDEQIPISNSNQGSLNPDECGPVTQRDTSKVVKLAKTHGAY